MTNVVSGVSIGDECKSKFTDLKKRRNHRFIVYKIEEDSNIVKVDKLGTPDQSYEDLTRCMPSNECRFAIFDLDFTDDDNCQKSKIIFLAWSPDSASVRNKMLYASSKDRFKKELEGIQLEIQATEPSEMSFDIIMGRNSRILNYN